MKRIFTMKHTLTLLFSLLLVTFIANAASPTANARIVIASEAGAKLDSDVNKGGGTDDTALILRWTPKVGQDGSLIQTQNNDPNVKEATSAQSRSESQSWSRSPEGH
jgi:hypothetical protein